MKSLEIVSLLALIMTSPVLASAAPKGKAKPVPHTTTKSLPAKLPIPAKPPTPSNPGVVEVSSSGTGTVTTNQSALGTGDYALSGFDFAFDGGDHAVKTISILRDEALVSSAFNDNDGNDRFSTWASYAKIDGAREFDTGSARANFGDVSIQRPRSGEVFVLTGFHLSHESRDVSIEGISIRPSPERGVVRVKIDGDQSWLWHIRLQYAYVPEAEVRGQYAVVERWIDGRDKQSMRLGRQRGTPVLQGFDIRYHSGKHHLRDFSVRPSANDFVVEFNDGGVDDTFDASIDYAILQ